MKNLLILSILVFSSSVFSQELTGKTLLESAIKYHDPYGNWNSFKGNLFITMEIPKKPNRDSDIVIDLPNQFFSVESSFKTRMRGQGVIAQQVKQTMNLAKKKYLKDRTSLSLDKSYYLALKNQQLRLF